MPLPRTYRECTELMKKNNPFYEPTVEGREEEISWKAFYVWCGAKLFIDNMFLAYGVDQEKVANEVREEMAPRAAEAEEDSGRRGHLYDLVFGMIPEPSEEWKARAVPWNPGDDPLEYISVAWDERIPKEVVEARLALLSEDDEKALRKEIDSGRDPLGVYLYFGVWSFPSDQENVSAAMTRICAYVGRDVETTLRLFKGCALSYLDFTEEEVYIMAKDAVDFVNEFRDTMSKINRPTFGYDKKWGLSRYGSRKKHW